MGEDNKAATRLRNLAFDVALEDNIGPNMVRENAPQRCGSSGHAGTRSRRWRVAKISIGAIVANVAVLRLIQEESTDSVAALTRYCCLHVFYDIHDPTNILLASWFGDSPYEATCQAIIDISEGLRSGTVEVSKKYTGHGSSEEEFRRAEVLPFSLDYSQERDP